MISELAHRRGEELLLWDLWGDMSLDLDGDLALIDEVAGLLLAADAGDAAAETKLAELSLSRTELRPGRRIRCASPAGAEVTIDLEKRGPAT